MNTGEWPPSQDACSGQWVPLGAPAWEQSHWRPLADCCTCVYLARISWGHMLGVRAEKGPLAEGMWLPKTKEDQE